MKQLAAIEELRLDMNWQMVRAAPNQHSNPSDVDWSGRVDDVSVPGTVAKTLLGTYQADDLPDANYDDWDWWYQCQFEVGRNQLAIPAILRFNGLATIAEVWLNGEQILTSRNMFRTFRLDVSGLLKSKNTLTVVFRSLSEDLKTKRARGRWKTNLVSQQQLRWIRTTLLGRIPGWTPPIQPVGPWRDVSLEFGNGFVLTDHSIVTHVTGERGSIRIEINLDQVDSDLALEDAEISILGREFSLQISRNQSVATISGEVDIGPVPLWWPNGYGEQALEEFVVTATVSDKKMRLASGKVGFRAVEVGRDKGRLVFVINGKEIFARGACWSTNDIVSLVGDRDKLRRVLRLAKQSGANMIRVGGTMVYETDAFYALCDELGLAVWQDFMFANMDYPADDPDFEADVESEVREQVLRLSRHPSVIAWCGNSEVEQQAAMFGMAEDVWRSDLFYATIPRILKESNVTTPYFFSSPSEGALPFHNSTGPAHYFGVGAYKQGFSDLAKSNVKFATECLAFSNMPSAEHVRRNFGSATPAVHSPRWKSGVPRDNAAGWDFEDIRDFYFAQEFGVDPIELRYSDSELYSYLSSVVSGRVSDRVMRHWRRNDIACSGALTWFFNDIVPGAGWGIVDSDGYPKPIFEYLRQAWAPLSLCIVDDGMDGLGIEIINDSCEVFKGRLLLQLTNAHGKTIKEIEEPIESGPGSSVALSVDALIGYFFDCSYRYRFGPPKHNFVAASLISDDRLVIASDVYQVKPTRPAEALIDAVAMTMCGSSGEDIEIEFSTSQLLRDVYLQSRALEFVDNYFTALPGTTRKIVARRRQTASKSATCLISTSNISGKTSIRLGLETISDARG